MFLGSFDLRTLFFIIETPENGLLYAEICVLSHKRSWSVFWCDLWAWARIQKKNTKNNGKCPPHADPFPLSHINQI